MAPQPVGAPDEGEIAWDRADSERIGALFLVFIVISLAVEHSTHWLHRCRLTPLNPRCPRSTRDDVTLPLPHHHATSFTRRENAKASLAFPVRDDASGPPATLARDAVHTRRAPYHALPFRFYSIHSVPPFFARVAVVDGLTPCVGTGGWHKGG
jgi:hypothetical protein